MAPSGRRRKTSRMDAALDAMIPFGFPKQLVRFKMNQLLKEYGGDVGYPFIEAEAYKVLIDAICEDEERKKAEENSKIFAEGETSMVDNFMEDEMVGDQVALAIVVPSGENVEPEGSHTPNTETQNNSRGQGDENSGNDIVYDQITGSQDMRIVAADNIGGEYNSPIGLPPPLLIAGSAATPTPARKRKPCYGWIGDGEEDDNFVILTPSVVPILKEGRYGRNH